MKTKGSYSLNSNKVAPAETGHCSFKDATTENGHNIPTDHTSTGKESTNGDDENEIEENEAPDGGWGWVVTAAATILLLLLTFPITSFGLLFSDMFKSWGTSSTVSAWVFNLAMIITSIASFVAGPVVDEFGWRRVTFSFSLLMGIGIILSAFATSPWHLMITFSVLAGSGFMPLGIICYLVVAHYFTRRRRVANAIMTTGACFSQIVMAPILTYMQHEVGHRATILISGGLLLNSCVMAMVLHPVHWHTKKPSITQKRAKEKDLAQSSNTSTPCARIMNKAMKNARLLKSPVFFIISVMIGMHVAVIFNLFQLVPFEMQQAGFTLDDSSFCLAVAGMCNLGARFVTGLLQFCPKLKVRFFHQFGSFLVAVSGTAFSIVDTLPQKAVTLGLCGVGYGWAVSLNGLVIAEELGLPMLLPGISLAFSLSGIFFLLVGPLAGFVRDVTGSYVVTLSYISACLLLSVVLSLFIPVARSCEQRQQSQQQKESQQQHPQPPQQQQELPHPPNRQSQHQTQNQEESQQNPEKPTPGESSMLRQPVASYKSVELGM